MINKNISVWRGNQTPPTNYHLWLSGNHIKKLENGKWIILNVLPEELLNDLYSAKLDLTKYENILGIITNDSIYDLNNYKLKGVVNIPIPHFGTYNILIRTLETSDVKITANGKTYNIGDVVSLKFKETSSIQFSLSNYVKIKEIVVLETSDLDTVVLYLLVPEDNQFYARYNNTWKPLNFSGDVVIKDGKIEIDKTDEMEKDNEKIITSRGVFNVVGDINTLLQKI